MGVRKTRKPIKGSRPKRALPRRAPRSILNTLPVRAVFVVVGLVGLAALGVALIGPRRFQDEFVRPIRAATLVPLSEAVTPTAQRAWEEARPWRDRVSRILASVNTDEVREQVAQRMKQWIDSFR